jgi:hypothetical protein
MKIHMQTKLTVQLVNEETLVKQTMNNVVKDPSEEAILELGEIIAALAPESTALDSVVETVAYEYSK